MADIRRARRLVDAEDHRPPTPADPCRPLPAADPPRPGNPKRKRGCTCRPKAAYDAWKSSPPKLQATEAAQEGKLGHSYVLSLQRAAAARAVFSKLTPTHLH